MKETLISFETAKLAKEVGFTLQSNPFGYITKFYEPSTKIIRSYGRHRVKNIDELIYAPTQSLLQKWLREKHNIHISVTLEFIGSDEWVYAYEIIYLPKNEANIKRRSVLFKKIYSFSFKEEIGTYNGGWDTYEEALEEGLKESLKLLKSYE